MEPTFDTFTNVPDNFWNIAITTIDGDDKTLNDYKGKQAYLFVNVASECGLTKSNYTELTEIYSDLKEKVFSLIISGSRNPRLPLQPVRSPRAKLRG